jgi:hypothetical protein
MSKGPSWSARSGFIFENLCKLKKVFCLNEVGDKSSIPGIGIVSQSPLFRAHLGWFSSEFSFFFSGSPGVADLV